jgi:hypothetical protein
VTVRVKNYARQVIATIEDSTNAGVNAGASFLTQQCRQVVSRRVFPRSKPGEPPRKETGWGQKHIRWTPANIKAGRGARVGIDISEVSPIHRITAIYMIWLELGTSRIAPRPWLVSTLLTHLKQIGEICVAASKAKAGRAA